MISSENYRYQLAVLRYRRYLVLSHNYHHYKPNSLPVADATRLDVADDALRVSTAALPSCLPFRYASHNATMILLPPKLGYYAIGAIVSGCTGSGATDCDRAQNR